MKRRNADCLQEPVVPPSPSAHSSSQRPPKHRRQAQAESQHWPKYTNPALSSRGNILLTNSPQRLVAFVHAAFATIKYVIYFKNSYPDANGPDKTGFFERTVREAADDVEDEIFATRIEEDGEQSTVVYRTVSAWVSAGHNFTHFCQLDTHLAQIRGHVRSVVADRLQLSYGLQGPDSKQRAKALLENGAFIYPGNSPVSFMFPQSIYLSFGLQNHLDRTLPFQHPIFVDVLRELVLSKTRTKRAMVSEYPDAFHIEVDEVRHWIMPVCLICLVSSAVSTCHQFWP